MVGGDTEGVAVLLVDATTLETVAELPGEVPVDGGVQVALDWSSDGGPGRRHRTPNNRDLGHRHREPHPTLDDAITDADHARFVPGERTLAVERDGVIEFVDVDSGTVDNTLMPPAVGTPFTFSPDGRWLVFPDSAAARSTCSASTRTPFP